MTNLLLLSACIFSRIIRLYVKVLKFTNICLVFKPHPKYNCIWSPGEKRASHIPTATDISSNNRRTSTAIISTRYIDNYIGKCLQHQSTINTMVVVLTADEMLVKDAQWPRAVQFRFDSTSFARIILYLC
jgi:hypothetical protein